MTQTDSEMKQVREQLKAAESGAFFREESFRGVIRVDGKDTLDLLNRLSTSRVDRMKPGDVRETLLVTEKGRVIDAILVVPIDDTTVRLLTSAPNVSTVQAWLEKFTIMEDCVYTDESEQFAQFTVYNVDGEGTGHELFAVASASWKGEWTESGEPVLLRYESVTGDGLRVLCFRDRSAQQKEQLARAFALTEVEEQAFTLWRIDQLLPAVGNELGAWSHPLEAGASAGVDFAKGCFIGQEVIARLENYEKVQRLPVRLNWEGDAPEVILPESLSAVQADGANAGFVTTHVFDPRSSSYRGIGLIRTTFAEAGTALQISVEGKTYVLRTDVAT